MCISSPRLPFSLLYEYSLKGPLSSKIYIFQNEWRYVCLFDVLYNAALERKLFNRFHQYRTNSQETYQQKGLGH